MTVRSPANRIDVSAETVRRQFSRLPVTTSVGRAIFAPFLLLVLVAVTIAVLVSVDGQAGANHNAIACDDDIPAGYTCVPLVNKLDSGPGITTPAVGELFYQWVGTDTMRIASRALPGEGSVADHEFCLDDDDDPYSSAPATSGPHCTTGGAAATAVNDGTTGTPAAGDGELDGSGEYEVRVTGLVSDGTVSGLSYYSFNDLTGYSFFVYHVHIGKSSTQAFWTTSLPTP